MPKLRRLPTDPEKSAIAAGLRYSSYESPGLTRARRCRGFAYFDGPKLIHDRATLARIRSLVIPPAWTKVWISRDPGGHLQAVGYDARNRRQYRYHPAYRAVRSRTKFERMPEMVEGIAKTRRRIAEHISLPGMPREKILATLIRILDATGIRIGNEASASENRSFGLTTLRNRHVAVKGATLRFHFTGKSGVKQELEVTDRRVARIVRQCHDLPGQKLFEYVDANGEPHGVSSSDVNDYLREASGQNLTAKDFRTWTGTVECAVALREIGGFETETDAKRNLVSAVRIAAEQLGNRAATCRAYYIHPAITEGYLSGELLPAMRKAGNVAREKLLSADECVVFSFVKRYRREPEQAVA